MQEYNPQFSKIIAACHGAADAALYRKVLQEM
jgi:hypothetical protein